MHCTTVRIPVPIQHLESVVTLDISDDRFHEVSRGTRIFVYMYTCIDMFIAQRQNVCPSTFEFCEIVE